MKKTITILGHIFLALIVVLAAAFGVLLLQGKRLDKESKAFADAAVLAIAANWDVTELKKRASPDFENDVDYAEIQEYLDSLRSLGKFVAYRGSTGEATIAISPRYGYAISADYAAIVDFEAGSTEVQITLIRQGGQWQILDFSVTPETLTEDKNIV